MQRRLTIRRFDVVALIVAVVALGALTPAALEAQTGGRMRVLVPVLWPNQNADDDFGEDVAEELRDMIEQMPRHAPVEDDEVRKTLRRFKMKAEELDCIKARQLAVQMNADLVMCGEYVPAGNGFQIDARFISSRTGDTFEIEPFPVPARGGEEQAARHIFTAFETYTVQLAAIEFCRQYLSSQQYENALQNCNQALESNPTSVPALYLKASTLLAMATQEAPATAPDAMDAEVDPTDVAADAAEGGPATASLSAEDRDQIQQALDALAKVLELNPVHQDALYSAGIAATKLEDQELARDYFNQYMELNPGNTDVRLKLAADMAKEGDPVGALAMLEEGIPQAPENITLKEYAGHFALAAGQSVDDEAQAQALFEKALAYYEEVFESKGAEAEPTMLRNMLATYIQLERTEEAVEFGSRAIEARPEDAGLWSYYAQALQTSGDLEQAIAALDTVALKDPTYKPVYARGGMWLLQAGRLSAAMQAFRKAIERNEVESSDAIARNVAVIGYNDHVRAGRYDTAMEYFDAARELATTAATRGMTNFFAGYALYEKGRQVGKPETAASARQALPIFQRALAMFENAGAYQQGAANLQKLIPATKQYIEIQEALIKRGR